VHRLRGLGPARFDSLGLIALGFVMAMTWNRSLLPTANSLLTSHFSLLTSRADGDQTGFLTIPASQSAASMTAVFTSLRVRQISGQACVLQRATSATVRCGAAATVVVHSLDASLWPPVQRGYMRELATLNHESNPNEVSLPLFRFVVPVLIQLPPCIPKKLELPTFLVVREAQRYPRKCNCIRCRNHWFILFQYK
jgi:hypothetical protein